METPHKLKTLLILTGLIVLWIWVGYAKAELSTSSGSAGCQVTFPWRSYHTDRTRGYNENHLGGFGGECKISPHFRFKGGVHENSIPGQESVHFGLLTTTKKHAKILGGELRPALYLTRITGYDKKNLWVPIPLLMYEHQTGIGFNLAAVAWEGEWIFGLEFKYLLGAKTP